MVAGGADARLLSSLNMELGQLFSDAVGRICDKAGVDPSWLGFVASHGQTVWHEPDASRVYADGKRYHASTLQLGEPALIAYDHNVRVVANFRAMDMAAGGQGAPMVALPLLIAAAPAGTRYVVDTDRGLCRGALIAFAVA